MNILTWSIIVLGSILVLIAFVLLIWRIVVSKSTAPTNKPSIGSISRITSEFAMSLASASKLQVLHNILIKNKYAKSGFSLIPTLVFGKNKCFLITNIVDTKHPITLSIDSEAANPIKISAKKSHIISNINFTHLKEINKYFQHNFSEKITIPIMVPLASENIKVKNNKSNIFTCLTFDCLEEIEKQDLQANDQLSEFIKEKMIIKLQKNNLIEAKVGKLNDI